MSWCSIFFGAVVCFLPSHLFSQNNSNTNAGYSSARQGLWNCKFADGNYYSVSLGAVDSVSQHEYLLDGSLRVTEVTVATRGSTQARFYTLEKPVADTGGLPGQMVVDGLSRITEEMVSRAPGSAQKNAQAVVKKFPETSHAKIIEYRLANRDQLSKLFRHLLNRWQGRSADDTYEVTD